MCGRSGGSSLPTLSAEPEPEPEPGAEPGMAAAIIAEFEAMRAGLDEIAEHSAALVAGHRKMLASTYDTAVLKDELERRNAAVSSVSERLRGTLRFRALRLAGTTGRSKGGSLTIPAMRADGCAVLASSQAS